MKRNRTVLGLSLAAATIALGACGGGDSGSEKTGAAEEPTSQESSEGAEGALEPDLEGIPDVVAEVNGEEVTKDEFVVRLRGAVPAGGHAGAGRRRGARRGRVEGADGRQPREHRAARAGGRGPRTSTVTEQDVEDELTTLAKENQLGSVDELFAALEKQGTTEEQARDQLESQMVIEELVADEAGSIEPTEQELRTIYAQAKTQAGEGAEAVPPYAKVRSQIVEQAKSDQLAEVAQTLVDDLRKDADITVNL